MERLRSSPHMQKVKRSHNNKSISKRRSSTGRSLPKNPPLSQVAAIAAIAEFRFCLFILIIPD
jgi:hypothetical protein